MDTKLNTRSINDAKVTDHHALIITEESAVDLSKEQQLIYDMIAGRMLEAFGEVYIKENTSVSMDIRGVHFSSKGSVTLVPSCRAVFDTKNETECLVLGKFCLHAVDSVCAIYKV